ncbi:MAG: phosphoribosylformylglycinamidine synthase subunit PurL, partial [Sphingomonadales bacterium]|nr:phosphoribosylformylglycinamidine synthase subunit PurL [Sphingomonadales bacterium]
EAYRNLCAVGAKPLAITNCLNFGNPQRPEIMAQIVQCLEGMADACRALDFPIVSGNVSLYNESKATGGGSAILPTPAIGGVGLLDDWRKAATIGFKAAGEGIFLIGGTRGELGQSLWLREILGREEGAPPSVDLYAELENGGFVRSLIESGIATAVHDISDGGLLVAVAEMALAGGMGAMLIGTPAIHLPLAAAWFGEDQARYLVTARDFYNLQHSAFLAKVECALIGFTGGDWIMLSSVACLQLQDLRRAHEGFFPALMGGEPAAA